MSRKVFALSLSKLENLKVGQDQRGLNTKSPTIRERRGSGAGSERIEYCSATCRPATLPLIMPDGSESHHPFCLSPGPAHLQCGSGKEWSNVRGQLFIQ
jgi:hypothetical protein